ncbi:MAG: glycosyltransferase family 9 protein [Bacteroidetes bacterium]|nr:glycosyltransferase family 9 protein [Bacteroidota bacterium]
MQLKIHYRLESWKEKCYYIFSILLSKWINGNSTPPASFNRILIIKIDEIGDMITALPSFETLRKSHPEAEITLLCKALVKKIVQDDPTIDKIVTQKSELSGKYDLILDLRSSWPMFWFALFNRPKYRLDRGSARMKNRNLGAHKHEVEVNYQIMAPVLKDIPDKAQLRLFINDDDKQFAQNWCEKNSLNNFVILHAGARRPLKQWAPERYEALANYLHQTGFQIVFGGGPEDAELNDAIIKNLKFTATNLAGKCSLTQFAAIAAHAKLFVGNDSGPMHLASAMNIPVIGLFGPSITETFRPYHQKGTFIHHKLPCNPCDQIHCMHPGDICINRISVEEVEKKIKALLA